MTLEETLKYMAEDAQSNNTQITTKNQAGESNNSKEYQKIVSTFDSRINDMKKLYQMVNEISNALKADNIQLTPELNQQIQSLNNNYTSLVKAYEDNEGFKKKLNDYIQSGGKGKKVEQPTKNNKQNNMADKALKNYQNSKNNENQNQQQQNADSKAESQNPQPTA